MTLRAVRMIPGRCAGATAWLLLMLTLFCRCGAGDNAQELPTITVLINVEGVTPDLHALHVRSTLNGVSAKNEQDIVNNLGAFVAYLPPGSRGTATFEVSGVTTNLCQTATGSVAGVLLEEAPYRLDLTVRLSPTATTTCPLLIELSGPCHLLGDRQPGDAGAADLRRARVHGRLVLVQRDPAG